MPKLDLTHSRTMSKACPTPDMKNPLGVVMIAPRDHNIGQLCVNLVKLFGWGSLICCIYLDYSVAQLFFRGPFLSIVLAFSTGPYLGQDQHRLATGFLITGDDAVQGMKNVARGSESRQVTELPLMHACVCLCGRC